MPRSGPRSRTSSRGSGPAGRWPSPAVAALTAPGWPPPASWSPPASTLETRSTGSMPRGAVPSHTRSNSPTCGPGAGRKGRRRACWVRPEPARSVAASARTTFEFAHGELEDRGGHADRILEPHERAVTGVEPLAGGRETERALEHEEPLAAVPPRRPCLRQWHECRDPRELRGHLRNDLRIVHV